jgi:hypothetical protein
MTAALAVAVGLSMMAVRGLPLKQKPDDKIEAGRLRVGHYASAPGTIWGAFQVMGPCDRILRIICGDGRDIGELGGWEHVSVSIEGKHPPNWQEMCWVKDHFWEAEETVVQFHPKQSVYKNLHPNCLHLWRSIEHELELPPQILV